jgi:sterol desaturase/sphingolipid hydroxylase (fatty acid hydroxylase superfamily)
MQALLRFGLFMVSLLMMMAWEYQRPRRVLARPRRERWRTNLSVTTLNTLLVWGTVGGIAYTTALYAAEQKLGLLRWMSLSSWVVTVATFLVLDFVIYLQHVLMHAVPALWRLHRVHHADLGFDATTGLRIHPVEIFLSLGLKSAAVLLLGATPWAVLAFEIVLNASSVFNHGNVAIPERWDRWLRWGIVTPDMHRIHHSARIVETNSNFGFSVSWWDRLCGTYRAEPALGQEKLEIGLSDYPNPLHLGELLVLPFRGETGHYPFTGARPVHI